LAAGGDAFLLEHPRYFSRFKFHKQKLLFPRASMKAYAERLSRKRADVHYVPHETLCQTGGLTRLLKQHGVRKLDVVDACDDRAIRPYGFREAKKTFFSGSSLFGDPVSAKALRSRVTRASVGRAVSELIFRIIVEMIELGILQIGFRS